MNFIYNHPCLDFLLFTVILWFTVAALVSCTWTSCQDDFSVHHFCVTWMVSPVWSCLFSFAVCLSLCFCLSLSPWSLSQQWTCAFLICLCCILSSHSLFLVEGWGWRYPIFLSFSTNPMKRPNLCDGPFSQHFTISLLCPIIRTEDVMLKKKGSHIYSFINKYFIKQLATVVICKYYSNRQLQIN